MIIFVILNFPLRSLHFSQMQEYPSRKLLIFDASAIWRPSNKETLSTWRCKNNCTNVGDLSIKENNGLLSVESSGFSNIILKISKLTAVCRRGLYWHKKATGACWVISGGQSSFVRNFISNIKTCSIPTTNQQLKILIQSHPHIVPRCYIHFRWFIEDEKSKFQASWEIIDKKYCFLSRAFILHRY